MVKSNHRSCYKVKKSSSRGPHSYVAMYSYVAKQVIKSWGECESKNKCLQSQYTTTVHRSTKGHTPSAQLHTTNKLKHKVTCSGTVINSSRTQHSQLRSTCHNVYSSHACYGCCPWDGTCSLVQLLVLITSAVVVPSSV